VSAHRRAFSLGIGALAFSVSPASAQSASLPPIRPVGAVVSRTKADIGDARSIRVLSDGRLLVHDVSGRRLLLVDSTLTTVRAIEVRPATSGMIAASVLLAARGDTSFLITGDEIDVIDPAGSIVRSIPLRTREIGMDIASTRATGDRAGRILYLPPAPFFLSLVPREFVGDTIVRGPEFVPVLRYDPTTQRTDTAAMIRGPRRRQALTRWENGGRGVSAHDPFPLIGDDWTVLADGTLAIARLQGYSIDWISPAGATASSLALAHAWTAISPAAKQRLVDSLRVAHNAARADSTFPFDSARYDSLALVAKANPEAITNSERKPISLGPRPVRMQFVAPADLPDSMPAFAPGGMLADAEDNAWIENYSPVRSGGGIVYDVVNRRGALIDRVELPPGSSLLAFTPGFVFLRMPAGNGAAIVKARIR